MIEPKKTPGFWHMGFQGWLNLAALICLLGPMVFPEMFSVLLAKHRWILLIFAGVPAWAIIYNYEKSRKK